MKATMTVVKSPRLDDEEAIARGEESFKPMPLEDLMALIATKPTTKECEEVVLENLRRQGLYKDIKGRVMK